MTGTAQLTEEVPTSGIPRQAERVARRGATAWLTGLPSAGKTTLALEVARTLTAVGVDVEVLDGDELRTHLSAGLGFSRADRDAHVERVGFVAELLARHGVLVLVPVIAPFAETRDKVRNLHQRRGTLLLQIHISTPLEVCAQRDVKGLYAKAYRGEISSMTGVDDPYEVPTQPDLRIDTALVDLPGSVALVLELLTARGIR